MLTLFYHVRRKPHANCDRCFLFFCGMKITTYNFSFAFIVHCLDRFHKLHFDLEILLCAAGEGSVGRAHSAAISFRTWGDSTLGAQCFSHLHSTDKWVEIMPRHWQLISGEKQRKPFHPYTHSQSPISPTPSVFRLTFVSGHLLLAAFSDYRHSAHLAPNPTHLRSLQAERLIYMLALGRWVFANGNT